MIFHYRCEMDVKKIATYRDQSSVKPPEVELRSTEQTKTAPTKKTTSGEASDQVKLSKRYQEIDKIRKVAMEMADIRTERVDQIRNAIRDGSYEVNTDQVATRILEEHW